MSAAKPIDYSKLTQRKVTIPIVALLGFIWVGFNAKGVSVEYFAEFFIKKAEAEEQFKVITQQVTQTQTLIVTHIHEYKLNENGKEMRAVTNQLYNLELYVAANGDSTLTQDRQRDLAAQLARLARVRACVVRNTLREDDPLRKPENCDAII